MANKDLVNKLVKKSFGRMYNGDWHHSPPPCDMGGSSRGDELEHISRRNIPATILLTAIPAPFPIFGFFAYPALKDVGCFKNQDGSELNVYEKFTPQAIKYARLYRKETGKEVKINIVSGNKWFSNIQLPAESKSNTMIISN